MVHPPLHQLVPRRMLIVKPSALGDIVHALPVLSGLRRRYPDAQITWLVNRSYESLLAGHPHLNATLAYDRHGGLRGSWALFRALWHGGYDLVIDLQGLFRSGLMARLTRAARRVGLSSAREGGAWFYTDMISVPDQKIHAVDRYYLVAQALGCAEPLAFHLPIQPDAATDADRLLCDCPRPWLMLAPGSRWMTKRWSPAHFAALAARAQATFGGTVVFVGGGDEQTLAQEVARGLIGPSVDLTGRTKLPQLAAVLQRADVVLANDTGPLHLAVALGRPVVAPYTCTEAALTGPYGQCNRAIETTVWCAGSRIKRCPRLECMTELTPERLWPALVSVLRGVTPVARTPA